MSRPTNLFFDTCYYIDLFHGEISNIQELFVKNPCLVVGHSIVMMELKQGVRTEKENQAVDEIAKSLTLIGPSIQNYLDTGGVLKKMTDQKWLVPKRLYEMQNDVLLALSAVEHDSWIVTRNKRDFERIKKFCQVQVIYY